MSRTLRSLTLAKAILTRLVHTNFIKVGRLSMFFPKRKTLWISVSGDLVRLSIDNNKRSHLSVSERETL